MQRTVHQVVTVRILNCPVMVILFIACQLLDLSGTGYCNSKIASKTTDDFVNCLLFWNNGHFVWVKIHCTVGCDIEQDGTVSNRLLHVLSSDPSNLPHDFMCTGGMWNSWWLHFPSVNF